MNTPPEDEEKISFQLPIDGGRNLISKIITNAIILHNNGETVWCGGGIMNIIIEFLIIFEK